MNVITRGMGRNIICTSMGCGDREVDEVEVQVVKLELIQAVLACLDYMAMIRVPQLHRRKIVQIT